MAMDLKSLYIDIFTNAEKLKLADEILATEILRNVRQMFKQERILDKIGRYVR